MIKLLFILIYILGYLAGMWALHLLISPDTASYITFSIGYWLIVLLNLGYTFVTDK